MISSFLLSLPILLASHLVQAWQPDYVLHISNDTIAADCTARKSTVINGTSPGPEIRVKEGDHVWIRVYNDMEESNTTLHWHGISQYMSPFADGTPATSQWPIAPNTFFDYEFMLEKGSAGTYMYHTHVGFQIVTAYGAFIVEDDSDRGPPYDYDSDITLLFGDFFHASDYNISAGLAGTPFKFPGDPQALTVNGNAFGSCNNSTSGGKCVEGCHTEVITVKPDTTYRVRAIGITALSFLYMAIEDHHSFELIEVDSGYVNAHNISHLEINSGQRYSFLLHTKSVKELKALNKTTFWGNLETRWRPTRDSGAFILQYQLPTASISASASISLGAIAVNADVDVGTANASLPAEAYSPIPQLNKTVPLPDESPFWVIADLSPLDKEDVPPSDETVSRKIFVSMQQLNATIGANKSLSVWWVVDQYKYSENEPDTPYLVQAYTSPNSLNISYAAAAANGGFDNATETIPIKLNETVDIVLLNLASGYGSLGPHPWHIHGKHPYLMAQGLGNFSDEAYAAARKNMTGKPFKRDTNIIYPGPLGADYQTNYTAVAPGSNGGWMVYRMTADVAGAFLLHCHLQPHAIMGMATVLLIGMDELPALPNGFLSEYATYNVTPSETPNSFFDIYSSRNMNDVLAANITL